MPDSSLSALASTISRRQRAKLSINIAITAAYVLTARFGISFGSVNNSASLIWAPGGISLAALLWFGFSAWPGVAAGAMITVAAAKMPLLPSLLAFTANLIEPLLGAWLLGRAGFHVKMARVKDAIALIFIGGILTTIVASLIGATAISWASAADPRAFLLTWETWWVGDLFGIIIITPFLLVIASERSPSTLKPRLAEAIMFAGFFVSYGLLVLGRQYPSQSAMEIPVAFGIFPFAIWAAIRFEQLGNVIVTFAVTFVTLAATIVGNRIMPRSPIDTLLPLQIYIAMAAGTGLILSAAIMESKRAMEAAIRGEEALLAANESLEQRVQERTQELERGRAQLTEAQELAHVGSWEWDVCHDKVTWSDELHRIYGLNQGELTFADFVNRVHPDDRIMAISTLREAAAKRACYDFTYRIVRPDGTVRHLHGRGSSQLGPKGELLKVFGTAQDITAQKEAECKLRRYFAEIQDLYNHAPCGYQSLDPNGFFVEVNDTGLQLLGYRRDELLGKRRFTEILSPSSQEAFLRSLESLRTGSSFQLELEIIRRDGRVLPALVNGSPIHDDDGELVRTRYSVADLTERKKAEEERTAALRAEYARREAEEHAQRSAFLSEATRILVSSLDYNEVLRRVARLAVPKICDWCMIDQLEDDGSVRRTVIHADPEVERRANALTQRFPLRLTSHGGGPEVIRTGRSILMPDLTSEMVGEDLQREPEYQEFLSSLQPRSYMAAPMTVGGRSFGAVSFISSNLARKFDQEDLALAEELARRAALAMENARLYRMAQEAVEIRDEFLSIASHELKTPITSLKLRLQLAQRSLQQNQAPTPGGLAKVFDISHAQVERLNALIDDLLDVSRIQAGKLTLNPEEFELGSLVRDIVSRFSNDASAAHCPVQVYVKEPIVGCWDRTRSEQVMVNLLSNALKYAPRAPIHISVERAGGRARVSVKDFGPGIPPEKQSRIFERYERVTNVRHTSGLGLGLFIVKQIVQAHQGRIWVESHPGSAPGAEFIVELPLPPAGEKSCPPAALQA